MHEELRTTIALIGGAIVFAVCLHRFFRGLKGHSAKDRWIEKATANGTYTTATLIRNKLILGNDESGNSYYKNDRMKCTYEYVVDGVSYKKKLTFQSPGMVAVKYPYTVTVYYDPRNPAKGICKEEVKRGAGCFGSLLFPAVVFAVIYQLLKLL